MPFRKCVHDKSICQYVLRTCVRMINLYASHEPISPQNPAPSTCVHDPAEDLSPCQYVLQRFSRFLVVLLTRNLFSLLRCPKDGLLRRDRQLRQVAAEGLPPLRVPQRGGHVAELLHRLPRPQHGLPLRAAAAARPHHRGADRCWVPHQPQLLLPGALHPVGVRHLQDIAHNRQRMEPELHVSNKVHAIGLTWKARDQVECGTKCVRSGVARLSRKVHLHGRLPLLRLRLRPRLGQCRSIPNHPRVLRHHLRQHVPFALVWILHPLHCPAFPSGLRKGGATTVGYVLIMEMVGPQHQTEVGIAIQLGWAVGYVTLVGVAWFFRHWFWLQLVISLSFLPFALFFSFIPESPRWLLTQGKTKKLEKLLIKAAAVNKREVSEDIKKMISLRNLSEKEVKQTASMLEVLKVPEMRNRAFEMIYLWFLNAFLYYALSYNTNDLAGDPYLNFFVSGFIEFPSYALVFWGIKSWGRRPTLISCMAAGGMACAAILLVPSDTAWLSTTFAMVGKFCVTGSFGILYLYTTEVFPTSVRNATLGSCSMCARVGSILAPFVRDLVSMVKATHETVPNVLYAFLALSGSLVTLLLPETRGLDLPDTLQEAADMGQTCRKGSAMESTPLTKQ
ncbi:hypothetical protein CEXT_201112 [Caerostris extrusa]|uniref:Organic cation transporter protein n=1 Tax=Caerostris extrusa TaxID=172846 RepID=A0AAV4S4M0_CAEEX|nr:hypothetical protein CEXT_201112 [Caerostris extrusa]